VAGFLNLQAGASPPLTTVQTTGAASYGDTLSVSGDLEPLNGGYAPPGVVAELVKARSVIVDREGDNPLLARLLGLRLALAQAIQRALPEPEAALLMVGAYAVVGGSGPVALRAPSWTRLQRSYRPLRALPSATGAMVIAELVAVTLATRLATLPVLAVTFHQVSLIAPIANPLTVPLLAPLLIVGPDDEETANALNTRVTSVFTSGSIALHGDANGWSLGA
jgi:hypothetical protein